MTVLGFNPVVYQHMILLLFFVLDLCVNLLMVGTKTLLSAKTTQKLRSKL